MSDEDRRESEAIAVAFLDSWWEAFNRKLDTEVFYGTTK